MPVIKAVLSTVGYDKKHLDLMKEAIAPAPVFHFDPTDEAGIRTVLDKVDVAVLDADLDDLILEGKNLKWIHCSHAGLNKSARPEVFERGIILTGAAGRSAPSLAEHAFFFILGLTYDVYSLHKAQQEHNWSRFKEQYSRSRGANGKTIGIIGLGNTGRAVAQRARAFDMHVLAYDRTAFDEVPDTVDEFFSQEQGDTIDRIVEESDFLVLCCRLCDETHHMIGEAQLRAMKPDACIINMARGPVIDQKALYTALRDGVIKGAGLDVFEVEPLPADDPLWDLPNVIITPHMTPRVPNFFMSSLRILIDNIARYRSGQPMRNRLESRDAYTMEQV